MAKQAAAKHVFSVSAPVNAAPAHVFDALSCASNFEALFSAVQDLSPQASGGFGGRASALVPARRRHPQGRPHTGNACARWD